MKWLGWLVVHPEGDEVPPGYGVAWRSVDYYSSNIYLIPVPFNLIVGYGRKGILWLKFKATPKWQREIDRWANNMKLKHLEQDNAQLRYDLELSQAIVGSLKVMIHKLTTPYKDDDEREHLVCPACLDAPSDHNDDGSCVDPV